MISFYISRAEDHKPPPPTGTAAGTYTTLYALENFFIFFTFKDMTNREYLSTLTNEELVDELSGVIDFTVIDGLFDCADVCPGYKEGSDGECYELCTQIDWLVVEWLKKERE